MRKLTKREKECIDGILQGLSYRKIGENLGIGERTVQTYVCKLFMRYDVKSRFELAALLQNKDYDIKN